MRILIISHEFYPLGGGGANACGYLAKHLAQLGVGVTVVSSGYKDLPRCQKVDGYLIYRLPTLRTRIDSSSPLEMISFIISCLLYGPFLIRESSPQFIISFFGFPAGFVACIYKFFYKVHYLISLRGHDVPGFLPKSYGFFHKLLKPLTRLTWKQASVVIADGEDFKGLAQKTADFFGVKVKVIPNAVDHEYFKPPTYASKNDYIKLLFLGRITKQKGLEYLLRAMVDIISQNNNLKLNIVGDGDERKSSETLVEVLGLKGFVTFYGWLNKREVIKQYQSADIFIMPSLCEGMSNAILEAMACGLPVITTDIPGNRELIRSGDNGFLVTQCDSLSLKHSIVTLIRDEQLRKSMGQRSREISLRLSWRNIAERYLQVINETKTF